MKCENAIKYYAESKQELIFRMFLRSKKAINEILDILRIFCDATIDFQSPNITLSDGYQIWLLVSLSLGKMKADGAYDDTGLITELLAEMKRRESSVLEFDAALAAQYLDPRFRLGLDSTKWQKAKAYIIQIWNKILRDRRKVKSQERGHINDPKGRYALLDEYYKEQEQTYDESRAQTDLIIEKMHQYDLEPRVSSHGFNIIDYWKQNKSEKPQLYAVSRYIFTIPPTQVVVERSFSDLSYILNPRRCQLKESTLETILNLRLNKRTTLEVFEDELNKIHRQYKLTEN